MQEDLHGGRVIATDLRIRLRESEKFWCERRPCRVTGDVKSAIEDALTRSGTTLIEVPVGKMPEPFGVTIPTSRAR